MAAAWLIAPAAVAVASCGIGLLVARVAQISLGALTTPTGFLAGLTGMAVALQLGLSGNLTSVLSAIAAITGFVLWHIERRGRDERGGGEARRTMLWSTAAAATSWAIGMLPLVGSGRLGVVGYYFNNDTAVHVMVVQLLRRGGLGGLSDATLSTEFVQGIYSNGYPLGSHVWPMFASVVTDSRAMFVWTPLIALSLGMLALTCFSIIREFEVSNLYATLVAIPAGASYLLFSYLAQGGMKELVFSGATITTVALSVAAARQDLRWRASFPAAIGFASMIAIMGIGAAAWMAPSGIALAAGFVAYRRRYMPARQMVRRLAALGGMCLAIASPLLATAIRWALDQGGNISDTAQIGNLLGPIPWYESFGIWLEPDYRSGLVHGIPTLNHSLIVLAALIAIFGIVSSIRKRLMAIPLGLFTAVFAAIWISSRYSIYYQAKTFVVLAPVLVAAVGAGLAAVWSGGRRMKGSALVAGVLLASAMAVSCAMVYATVWLTPSQRYDELGALSTRLAGKGSVLVSDREDYSRSWFTGNNTYQPWQAGYLLLPISRSPNVTTDPFHTPDLDDYTDAFMAKFNWIVDRRKPAGSRAPGNFRLVARTPHYNLWKRTSVSPREHIAIGAAQPFWTARLDCASPAIKAFTRRARGQRIRVAEAGKPPVVVESPDRVTVGDFKGDPRTDGSLTRVGGRFTTVAKPRLRPGVSYDVYLEGALGPGFAHNTKGRRTGEASDDLGNPSSWLPLGSFTATGRDVSTFEGLTEPLWRSGWTRSEVIGPVSYVPSDSEPRLVVTDARGLRRFCGKRIDWVERF